MLTVQCPDCDYTDQGYDTDLIMIELKRHEQNCTAQSGGFILPESENPNA